MEKATLNLPIFIFLLKKTQKKFYRKNKIKKNLARTIKKSVLKRTRRLIKKQINSFKLNKNYFYNFYWLSTLNYIIKLPVAMFETKLLYEQLNFLSTKNKKITAKTQYETQVFSKNFYRFLFTKNLNKKPKKNKTRENTKRRNNVKFNQWAYLPLFSFLNSKRILIITHNLYDSIPLDAFNVLVKTALALFPFLKLNRVATRLVSALQLLFVFKDSTPLLVFIKNVFQNVHYASHNQYYVFVTYLIQYVVGPQLKIFSCLGVKALFRGKLGVGGNSRKSVQRIFYGVSTSSTKFVKIHKSFTPIKTKTGVVGFWLFLTW